MCLQQLLLFIYVAKHICVLLTQINLSAGCRAGLHMTAETMRGQPMLASTQKADCMLQISHDNSLSELAQLCISPEWFKTYKGRLERMRLYRQQRYHHDATYMKAVIHSNNA